MNEYDELDKFTIEIKPEHLELVEGYLVASDIFEYAVDDPRDLADYMEHSIYYDYEVEPQVRAQNARVTVYLQNNDSGIEKRQVLAHLLTKLDDGNVPYGIVEQEVAEEDWMNSWKAYYKPIPIGKKLVIKPTWEALPEELRDRIVLEIDPSSSFGTGTHETTRLCLRALEALPLENAQVMDMGCGSGILAVGAALYGAAYVTAVDIEEDAMRVTRENMDRNNISREAYRTVFGDVLSDEQVRAQVLDRTYNVILSNIIANVVIGMEPIFSDALSKNGLLVASGIILDRLKDVEKAYLSAGYEYIGALKEGEWAALILRYGK